MRANEAAFGVRQHEIGKLVADLQRGSGGAGVDQTLHQHVVKLAHPRALLVAQRGQDFGQGKRLVHFSIGARLGGTAHCQDSYAVGAPLTTATTTAHGYLIRRQYIFPFAAALADLTSGSDALCGLARNPQGD